MGKLVSEGARIFRETVADEDQKLAFQRELVEWLWASRDEALDLHDWLDEMRRELIAPRVQKSRSLRSEEHTSELQSLMRISYAVFCLKKKKNLDNQMATKQLT